MSYRIEEQNIFILLILFILFESLLSFKLDFTRLAVIY